MNKIDWTKFLTLIRLFDNFLCFSGSFLWPGKRFLRGPVLGVSTECTNGSLVSIANSVESLLPLSFFASCNGFFRHYRFWRFWHQLSPKPRVTSQCNHQKIFHNFLFSVIDITILPSPNQKQQDRSCLLPTTTNKLFEDDRLRQTPRNHGWDHGESLRWMRTSVWMLLFREFQDSGRAVASKFHQSISIVGLLTMVISLILAIASGVPCRKYLADLYLRIDQHRWVSDIWSLPSVIARSRQFSMMRSKILLLTIVMRIIWRSSICPWNQST